MWSRLSDKVILPSPERKVGPRVIRESRSEALKNHETLSDQGSLRFMEQWSYRARIGEQREVSIGFPVRKTGHRMDHSAERGQEEVDPALAIRRGRKEFDTDVPASEKFESPCQGTIDTKQ